MTPTVISFPASDNALLAWSLNFKNLITAAPTDYGLVAGDATAYGLLHTAYATALAACEPSVRTKGAVVGKNAAKTTLKNGAILVANKINSDSSVTEEQKVTLGIPSRAEPTPIPAPSNPPLLEIVALSGWTAKIRLRAAAVKRGKPPGTFGATVFSHVGATPPTDIGAWKFEANIGKVVAIDVIFSSALAAGTTVWLTAMWFNGRKESGPACPPVSCNLPGGSVSMAA